MKAEYLYHSGDDLAVVNAAKVSFDNQSDWDYEYNDERMGDGEWVAIKGPAVLSVRDKKLINYLADHNHWTPFAHNSITLRMKAPVPIRTQCFKHKQGFVENEESRRYISSKIDIFVPDIIREAPTGNVKQGSGGKHLHSNTIKDFMERSMLRSVDEYEALIEVGVCPEQARFVLPQGAEVSWIWTGSLAAYARFYGLRKDPHAQYEIQQLAEEVGVLIEPLFPVSWEALTRRES